MLCQYLYDWDSNISLGVVKYHRQGGDLCKEGGGMQMQMEMQMAALSSVECFADQMRERGGARQRSGIIGKDVCHDQVICPKPLRMAVAPCTAKEIYRSRCRIQSQSTLRCEGEPSYEILDIFLNKSGSGDQANVNSSLPYFCGSPPSRSANPLVNDVQFIENGIPPSPVMVSQQSSCGSSIGSNHPSVRIEGFASSSSESHCSVLMPA